MANATEQTVVAAFRTAEDAQAAAAELQSAGIPTNDIYLESSGADSGTGTYGSRATRHEGGVAGWFKSVFGAGDDQATYERAVGQGNYLLTVDAPEDQLDRIEAILNRHSPVDVHGESTSASGTSRTQAAQAQAYQPQASQAQAGRSATAGGNAGTAIPVVEENLQVGKRRDLRGGVRVYSRVTERPVSETVNLQEERVRVDRRPANRAASEADLRAGQENVIEVQEFAETPVVAKQARVVEEVVIGKETIERAEQIRDSVRRTDVRVEPLAAGTAQGATATSARGTAAGAGATAGYAAESPDLGTGLTDAAGYDDKTFRQDFQTRYGSTAGAKYDDYAPGYRYGFESATDTRYKGRDWQDVENDLRTDYSRRYPNSAWEKMKDSVRTGWNKVTGRS